MRRRAAVWIVLLAALANPVGAETELVLIDGRVLEGIDARRDGDVYVLTLDSGEEISFPAQLVASVRLKSAPRLTDSGLTVGRQPENLAGSVPEGPSGLRSGGDPQTLAGDTVTPPTRSEQLEALGPPSEFQKGIIDPSWKPSTDWDMDPHKNNNFAPSTWAEDIIDPSWEPESAFDADEDVLAPSRSKWQKGVFDSTWKPTDGFAGSVGNR